MKHSNFTAVAFTTFLSMLLLFSCATPRYIDIEREVITYKDSTILHQDTIYTKIPVEFYYDYSPIMDTLHLETSVAAADAYLDTASLMIKGGIYNKAVEIPTEYIWKERIVERTDTVYVEKTKEVPYEVVKYKTPGWSWFLLALFLSIAGWKLYKYIPKF